jgi:ABC-type polysaccharide/polyol phosphate export permease
MDAFRWSVLGVTHQPEWWAVVYATAISMVVGVLGAVMFKKTERMFADVI